MNLLHYIPKFILGFAYEAIEAEINAITLPIDVPGFDAIKTELLAKIHAILL